MPDLLWVGKPCLQIHQFGYSAFNSAVMTTDDAGRLQLIASVITSHLNTSSHTLANVNYSLAISRRFFQRLDKPWRLWGIPTAEGTHDNGAQVG